MRHHFEQRFVVSVLITLQQRSKVATGAPTGVPTEGRAPMKPTMIK
jgi:hypothetical protein